MFGRTAGQFLGTMLPFFSEQTLTQGTQGGGSIPAANLVDWFKMNEASGTTFLNSSVANSTNTATTTSSWVGANATFSGTQLATSLNSNAFNFTGAAPFSVSAWINPANNSTNMGIIGNENVGNGFQGWTLLLLGGVLYTAIGGGVGLFSSQQGITAVAANVLQHVAMVYNGNGHASGLTLYVNGVAIAMTSTADNFAGSGAATGLSAFIGNRSDSSLGFTGVIGDIRIFNIALTQAQIAGLFAGGDI